MLNQLKGKRSHFFCCIYHAERGRCLICPLCECERVSAVKTYTFNTTAYRTYVILLYSDCSLFSEISLLIFGSVEVTN